MTDAIGTNGIWRVLQHGDSAFPSGQSSFSWGLETLVNDGRVHDAATLYEFVAGQLRFRWASVDRPLLLASYRCCGRNDAVAEVDRTIEAMTLVPEFGSASRRNGRSMLRVHARLETPGASEYQAYRGEHHLPAHSLAIEGLIRWGQRLDETAAQALSAYTLASSLCSAMVRLGRLGPLETQQVLDRLGGIVEELLQEPLQARPAGFVPEAEAAGLRHEYGSSRIFGN